MSTGKTVSQISDNRASNIKIGLLIPGSKSIAAVQGAELAVREANEHGGLNGQYFQLVVRSMEGPWGTGSKQVVNLIFNEQVWALLGSHDGRNAHVAEQAATKSATVFVSAWSGDPTLSQAFVPWFFNCVPNDNQQAASLNEEIYNKRKFNKIVVVHGSDYDSNMALNSFLKSAKMPGRPEPVQYNFEDYKDDLNSLTLRLSRANIDCLILFCQPSASLKILRQIHQEELKPAIFGSLTILNENELTAQELKEFDNYLSIPSEEWPVRENLAFRKVYQNIYKKIPGMVASYSYDGMGVLIEAIRNAGSFDREKIQKSLENISYKGVTGPIQFDDKGNRSGNIKIMRVKEGVPVSSE